MSSDTATITIRSYAAANPAPGALPTKTETHGLVHLRWRGKDQTVLCNAAGPFGPVGNVSCQLTDTTGTPGISIVITGTFLFDRTMALPLDQPSFAQLSGFLSKELLPA